MNSDEHRTSLVVYADFVSPLCYLASHRADALTAAGAPVDWRAVDEHPRWPVTGTSLDPAARARLRQRLTELDALLLPDETLRWAPPSIVPRGEAAVSGYAEAYGAGVADDVRRLLFTAYWLDGLDIGSVEVLRRRLAGPILRGHSDSEPLRRTGFAVSVTGAPITTSAWLRVRAWREEWLGLPPTVPAGELPILVEDGSAPVAGETALRRLEKELLRLGAAPNPDLPDPARYPAVRVRPTRQWVSQVGGPWTYAWMTS